MKKICPRCGKEFECRHEDISRCQCSGASLTHEVRIELARAYPGMCLCAGCLGRIEEETRKKS